MYKYILEMFCLIVQVFPKTNCVQINAQKYYMKRTRNLTQHTTFQLVEIFLIFPRPQMYANPH